MRTLLFPAISLKRIRPRLTAVTSSDTHWTCPVMQLVSDVFIALVRESPMLQRQIDGKIGLTALRDFLRTRQGATATSAPEFAMSAKATPKHVEQSHRSNMNSIKFVFVQHVSFRFAPRRRVIQACFSSGVNAGPNCCSRPHLGVAQCGEMRSPYSNASGSLARVSSRPTAAMISRPARTVRSASSRATELVLRRSCGKTSFDQCRQLFTGVLRSR